MAEDTHTPQHAGQAEPSVSDAPQAAVSSLTDCDRSSWWTLGLLGVFAFALRVYRLGESNYLVDDATANVTNAYHYVASGILGPDNWWTQPLKHVLTALSIAAFGDDPIGWRMRNVLFGVGVVLVTYLLARAAFRETRIAMIAAALIAVDPLSIAFSRNTGEDVPATFFVLLSCWLLVLAWRRDRAALWVGAGVVLGLAWATRWYTVIPGALMAVLSVVATKKPRRRRAVQSLTFLVLIPLATYTLTYLPWAMRGYSVAEWLLLSMDAYTVQSSGLAYLFSHVSYLAGPHRWFVQWMGAAVDAPLTGGYAGLFNNPVVWCLFPVSVLHLLWRGARAKSASALLIGSSFVALYLFYVSAPRPILLYSSLPLLPLGALATGFAANAVLKKYASAFAAAAVIWCLFLYPLVVAIPVATGPYGWLLQRLVVR